MDLPDVTPDGSVDDAIAVVGMACRFPGDATDIESFWEMIRDGRDAWSEIPSDRFNAQGWYHPDPNRPGSFHIRGAHFLKEDIAAFDAPFFSISTAEAVSMDPQQRMLLEVVYEALDSAGIPVSSLSNTATSVFCGSFVRDYEQPCMRDPDTTPPYSATGNGIAILANRISHAFDFAGTSQTIDTGCSASMIAVHQACKSLLSGESTVGVAAGVGLIFSPNTLVPMANLNILGPDGRCYTFDKRANGYGRGEGTGVLVLKRLKDAIAANDTIRAVIRATASNQDGHTQGITLPSKERQVQNMSDVYNTSGLDITRTAYMECHGTGTQAGDVKETQAVTELFCKHRTPANPLLIGSIKTNIGHLEGSAGVAGLIKGILVVERGYIPKHLNFTTANPNIDFEGMKLKIASELTPWPVAGLRRASVNSFGFGGTNAHVVLDDAPHFLAECRLRGGQHNTHLFPGDTLAMHELRSFHGHRNHLFVFSGHDAAALTRVVASQAKYVAAKTAAAAAADHSFETDYTYTLLSRRSRLHWRTFVVAASAAELVAKLDSQAVATPLRAALAAPTRLGLIFCGQGAQWHAMGRELLGYRAFYASISAASWYMQSALGSPFSLWDELHRSQALSLIDEPHVAQPATTAIQVALVDLLVAAGLTPSAVVGHSSGEIAAAYAAGALRREDAWAIAYFRGRCIAHMAALSPNTRGGMLAVALSEDDARRAIATTDVDSVDSVDVACINGPASVTLSGDADGIARLHDHFRDSGVRAVRVNVTTAYHSRHMTAISDVYLETLQGIEPVTLASKTTFYSSVFGRAASASELGPAYWVNNLVLPVQFFGAVQAMIRQSAPEAFVEVSPHRVWESTLRQIQHATSSGREAADQPAYSALLHRHQDATATVLTALGDLWARGFPVNLDWALTSHDGRRPRHLVDVPSYPWDHTKRYWHESHLSQTNRFRSHGREDIIGAPLENATPQDPRWRGFFRLQENPWLADHVVQKSIIYPAGGMVAMAIEAAKQLAVRSRRVLGYEVTDFAILKPMLIPTSPQGLENMLSAHIVDEKSDTAAYDFSILSKPTDGAWITHAQGRLAVVYCAEDTSVEAAMEARFATDAQRQACRYVQASCHARVEPRQFYEMLDVVGMTYGPQFRNLVAIAKGDMAAHAVIAIPDTKARMPFQYEFDHVIHPATLDTMLQSVFALGNDDGEAMLPCSARRIFVAAELPRGAGARFRGYTTAKAVAARQVRADITMLDDELRAPTVVIEDLLLKSVGAGRAESGGSGGDRFLPAHRNLCSEFVWKQDASSIAALGFDFPASVAEMIDLASHKNPALSILYHIPDGIVPGSSGFAGDLQDLQQLDVVAETLKATNYIFENLTAGYDTPRFAQCTLSGTGSDKVWQHMRLLKGGHPGFDRVRHCASLSDTNANANERFHVTLCSIVEQTPAESLAELFGRVADDGWLVLLSKLGEMIGAEQYATLRSALQAAGFEVGRVPAKGCAFLAAQKTTRADAPTLPHNVVFLLPDVVSETVVALKDALRPVLEAQLAAEVRECCLASFGGHSPDDSGALVLSFVEMDAPLVFDIGPALFAGLHRLLTHARGVLWLSQGGQVDCNAPDRSPFAGLARTLRSEASGNSTRIVTLDINHPICASTNNNDAAPAIPTSLVSSIAGLLQKLSATPARTGTPDNDVEFSFSSGRLMIPRLMPLTLLNRIVEQGPAQPQVLAQTPLLSRDRAMKLDVSTLAAPGRPRFVEDDDALHRPLLATEVRIAVYGTNLLPEDVVAATSDATPLPVVGTDAFGHVVAVGPGVVGLRPGCFVVARMRDTLKTHVIVDESRVRRIKHPGEWRGSCPTAFATAVYALKTGRRISKGDFVLVYGASTAYGQAAIGLALTLAGHVLVACSTPAEKTMMREHFKIPACHILDIPAGNLEMEVLALTGQCGADVVFDPTSQYIDEALHCVAECGRVIRVAQNHGKAPGFPLADKNVSFETVDIDLLETRRPAEAQRLAADVSQILQLAPGLEYVHSALEYNMCDIQTALDHARANLFAGPHIVFTEADAGLNMVDTPIQLTQPVALSPAATYLLVGGLGGLGRSIAEHLAQNGAKHIAFFSRSGATAPAAQALLAKLQASGVDAAVFQTDICSEAQLKESIRDVHSTMPPIRGAIQCAAVVDDVAFANMDYARWRRVFAPKTTGSYNLHKLLPRCMDFFVFLSSSSGVIGNRGQASYAAGNCFQDALAQHRSSALGMHSVSLDLGLVLGAGMVAENEGLLDAMKASGFIGIRISDALFLLDRAMARPATEPALHLPAQVVTTVGTGGLTIQNQPADPFWTRTALFRYLNQVDAPPHGLGTADGRAGAGAQDLRTTIRHAASSSDAADAVCAALIATVARRKAMVADDFDAHQSLDSYGIDSLDSMFVLGWIARETGVTVQTVEGLTMTELSRDIARRAREAE